MKQSAGLTWQGRPIRGAVFDLDGTLTDAVETYYQLFREATQKLGIHLNKEDLFEPLAEGAAPWDRAIPEHLPDRLEKIEQCKSLIPVISREVVHYVHLLPGVERVITALMGRNVELGIVTDSMSRALAPLYKENLDHHFRAIIAREDGFPRKPEPAGVIECLKRLDVDPSEAITIGDSLMDIRVGKRVGTLTIGVLSGVAKRWQMEAERPTAVVTDMLELLSILGLEESPPQGLGHASSMR